MPRKSKFDMETRLSLAREATTSSPKAVAVKAGVSVGAVYYWMRKAGLKAPSSSRRHDASVANTNTTNPV